MRTPLPGYQLITILHEGTKTVIYQGRRESEPTSVIIKTLKAEYPTLEEIARLKHEYQILQFIDIPGIIKPIELKPYEHGLALILEDFAGQPLKQYITSQKTNLINFLQIAIQLAQILGELHQNQIIHKDIKPQNILINPQTGEIKLIDFSISSRLEKENSTLINPNFIEGTLAYMSPEQTGRMNRSIDYRTDFYSLGITFYEMLAGQLPFNSNDPMELLHCHIAKQPASLSQLNSEIPKAVVDIVMKLLAKTAEDRYQNARGLKADLEECLKQLQEFGQIKDFTAGKLDRFGQFLIPQKLYGRETEVSTLMAAFERVAVGSTEMMLVSGYSGIGKTCVVQEVHKPIVRQRGYFIAGKFDQFKRNIPYSAFIQAFQELIRQLLTENSENIGIWKEQLVEALGQNGRVIINVIPEVELIMGEQPEVPQLGLTESQNRFNRVYKQFIPIFTKPEHPLVLFLDDLQWADSASLKLLQLLITDTDSEYLLLIGAYRDNEVSPTHPTIQTIEEIEKTGAVVNNIVLQALDISNVRHLVADTIHEANKSRELADLLFNKTQGNPFFLTQLFKTLHSENLLTFDFIKSSWEWDINQIQSLGIADYTVVELVARNIKKLPEATQQILQLAACIGNRFNLDVCAIVNEKSPLNTADDLWSALQAGLILPLSNDYKIPLAFQSEEQGTLLFDDSRVGYKFLHDRVQQAAYSMIPENQKKSTHLKIGKLLLNQYAENSIEENIFDIVNQLNIGMEFITQSSEKDELANLNLIAGKKAKAATAYEAAVRYLNVGLELLPEKAWQSHYELMRDLHLEALEAEYVNINFERAQELSKIVLSQVKTILEKVKVYELKIPFYFSQNQGKESLDTSGKIMEILGVYLPKNPNKLNIIVGVVQIKLAIDSKQISDLAKLPEMIDPYKLAAMRILINTVPVATNVKPTLFPLIVFKMINLCLIYGNSPLSAYAYGIYGTLLCVVLGDIDKGYQFGKLSVKVLEQFDAREIKAKVHYTFNSFMLHWKKHINETIEPLIKTFQYGIESGDIEYASYSLFVYSNNLLWSGKSLDIVADAIEKSNNFICHNKQELTEYLLKPAKQFVLDIVNYSSSKFLLISDSFSEEIFKFLKQANNHTGMALMYVNQSIMFYLFKDYLGSIKTAKLAEKQKQNLVGMLHIAQHNFYYSLALCAHYPTATKTEKKQYLKKLASHQKQMKMWATHAPMNFQHKYELVEAEKARVLGQNEKAATYYDRAISGAKEQGFIQEEALANELAAEFYLVCGREKVAKTYMTEAYYCYIRWGAVAKVRDLDERYPSLISRTPQTQTNTLDPTRTTTSDRTTNTSTSGNSASLDLATVMKAAQALSGEMVLGELLRKLMTILIENAGATRGCLLAKSRQSATMGSDRWVISATGLVEGSDVTVSTDLQPQENTVSSAIINYVDRTKEIVVLNNATSEGIFTKDPYIQQHQPKSVLCVPLLDRGQLSGIVYLENNLTTGAFTDTRLTVLQVLSGQAAIAITNAKLYTEVSASEKQLRASQSQLIQFLEAVPVGIFIANQHGQPYYANQAAQQILGKGIVPNVSGEQLVEVYQAYLAGTKQLYPAERDITLRALKGEKAKADDAEIHQGDKIIPLEAFGTPVYDEDRNIAYAIVAFNDISDRKHAEAEREKLLQQLSQLNQNLEQANQQLEEYSQTLEQKVEARTAELKAAQKQIIASEKLASLGALTAGVAHEIRNPLNFVTSLATLSESLTAELISELQSQSEKLDTESLEIINENLHYLKRNVSEINAQGQRANNIIQSMLMHARTDGGIRQKTNINGLVAQAAQLAYHSIRAKDTTFNLMLNTHFDESIGEQEVAFSDLSRALINIIDNACYAAHIKHKQIGATFNPTVDITTFNLDKFIEIRIRDNGIGIPEENQQKIFHPFFTTKPPGQGTGLGLSITHDIIVGQHRGNVEVQTEPGEYTEFTIILPKQEQ